MVDKPSLDPADNGTLMGVFRSVLNKMLQNVDDMLPALVVAYDRDSNRAQVQPLIMVVTTEKQQISRAQIASVPVFQIGGGNFMLNFPIKKGDFGWIKANDRDISLFMQSMKESPPNTMRKKSFEDGVFFPQIMRDFVINDEDAENVVLQTLDGTQRIAIWPDKVKITSDQRVIVDAPLTEFTGAIIWGTNPEYEDTITGIGNIITTGDVIAQDISLVTHTHGGVQTGAGNTAEPNS